MCYQCTNLAEDSLDYIPADTKNIGRYGIRDFLIFKKLEAVDYVHYIVFIAYHFISGFSSFANVTSSIHKES